jgi:hypothetical protein
MTAVDDELADLSAKIGLLSKRAIAGLYWACALALLPEFVAWATHRSVSTELLLQEALGVAHNLACGRPVPTGIRTLLSELEASAPDGESPDAFSSVSAQDCWICADIGIRAFVDDSYPAGPAIEYALEPVIAKATEQLFRVSQVGSGDDEEAQVNLIIRHSQVGLAIEFCRWAADYLRDRPSPTADDLETVRSRAAAIAP